MDCYKGGINMYQISKKIVPKQRVVFIHYEGPIRDANKVFPKVFMSVKGKVNGAPFFRYIKMKPNNGLATVQLCVPTEETPSNHLVQTQELEEVEVLSTTHHGSYETIMNAYSALDDYANKNKLKLTPPWSEVFIKGPGRFLKGNPKEYITEIHFPYEEIK
ncbi:MAG: GyrI-like domain-containing protein [Tissierellia bacterium]|nr:GyrI-like domain-containing protein [Tissierellia bacterium]